MLQLLPHAVGVHDIVFGNKPTDCLSKFGMSGKESVASFDAHEMDAGSRQCFGGLYRLAFSKCRDDRHWLPLPRLRSREPHEGRRWAARCFDEARNGVKDSHPRPFSLPEAATRR